MAEGLRQRNLFAAEDFKVVYDSFRQANFQAYDYDSIRGVLINYIQQNYPENFNVWIQSNEFVALIEMISFLAHSLAFRIDLAGRENFLSTAERRESILRIVDFLGYVPSRSLPGRGNLKITSIRTTQNVFDINGENLKGQNISFENDYQNFLLVLNEVLSPTNKFGRPTDSITIGNTKNDIYKTNITLERDIVFPFTGNINNISQQFEVHSVKINKTVNTIQESVPDPFSSFDILYKNDNQGLASNNTGFFTGFKQGTLAFIDVAIEEAIPNLIVDVNSENINNTDIHVQEINDQGQIITSWTKVDSSFGANSVFNLIRSNRRKLYTVKTLDNDNINVVFGDGVFSEIPRGILRIWYRTSVNQTYVLNSDDIGDVNFGFDYTAGDGNLYNVSIEAELVETVDNASARESVTSIRTNAGRVFATQDRMVSGEDYSIYPLTASENVRKIKAINRTYTGHSRYIKHNDPTAQYQSVDIIGCDGYLYTEPQVYSNTVTLPTTFTDNQIFEKYIGPIIKNPEIVNLFYDKHNPINTEFDSISNSLEWQQISRSFNGSTGYFTYDSAIERVGKSSTSFTKNILPNSIIEFIEPSYNIGSIDNITVLEGGRGYDTATRIEFLGTGSGARGQVIVNNGKITEIRILNGGSGYENPIRARIISTEGSGAIIRVSSSSARRTWARVIDIYEDGLGIKNNLGNSTGTNTRGQGAIILSKTIPNSARVSKIFPSYSTEFIQNEKALILEQITNRNTFGIRYDIDSTSWKIISAGNLQNADLNNPTNFSLDNTGDNTGNNRDASWFIRVDYSSDRWRIVSRRIRYIFGSEDDLRFYNQNNHKKFNLETNKPERDRIIVSRINTAADGSQFPLGENHSLFVYRYFAESSGITDDRFLSVSISDGDNDNYPDNPLVFRDIVGSTDKITIADKDNKQDYRTPVLDGIPRTGRTDLTFTWRRISDSIYRIDPSISNIHDIFVLTQNYDTRFREWILKDRNVNTRPNIPSEIDLEKQFDSISTKKTLSDTIIYRAAEYRILFGELADVELQGIFRIVPVTGTTLTDNEIKTRTLAAINNFFNIDNWDFGEKFFFTGLSAYIHQQLPGVISSIVIVPNQITQDFGDLFQITPESNELFIPDVTLKDIEIVNSLNL